MEQLYDVVIIGGGVVGSAIAREMSRYNLKICVLEKNLDVCNETSGRNSGVVHGGFAYDRGSLKAKLCLEGNKMMDLLSKELDFEFLRCGKVLVGNTLEELESLKKTLKQGEDNGVEGLRIIDEKELKSLVPHVTGKFAMFSLNSGILDPFGFNIALAENACNNGVKYFFDNEVIDIKKETNYKITTTKDIYYSRWVVNSAGLGCGKISDMLGIKGYKIIGSKGDYIVLDKRTGPLLPMPAYPVPGNTYMGIHVTNTTNQNVIIGPNAEMVDVTHNYGVSKENIDFLALDASKLWPCIKKTDYIRNYSGILPKWVDESGEIQDFKIEILDDIAPNAINLVGIESPGLTAAVPIARYAIELMKKRESLTINTNFNQYRKGIIRFENLSDEEKNDLILKDPNYGEIICKCEKVTKAEILQAIENPLGVNTLVGIKYRTHAMMGRCQGGYCQMRITQMIKEQLNKKDDEILYSKNGSYMFFKKLEG